MTKSVWGSGGTVPHILKLVSIWRWVVSPPVLQRQTNPPTFNEWDSGWPQPWIGWFWGKDKSLVHVRSKSTMPQLSSPQPGHTANLLKFNKGAYISGTKVFNHLPQYIKALTNDHKYFKSTLKRFLYHHSFYSMNDYEYTEDRRI